MMEKVIGVFNKNSLTTSRNRGIIKIQRTKGEKKMRKISPEEREMLIVAENFGCVVEVIAELGITAEEAREIIWGED